MRKMRKICAVLLSAAMALSFAGCASGSGQPDASSIPEDSLVSSAEKDGFDFADYLGDEIVDIRRADIGNQLDSVCETYRFVFMSDGLKIKGFISIPLTCLETRTPCQCVIFCNGGNSNLLNDVIRLIEFCDTMFDFADIRDLCVEGESRGGLMTYMIARRDKRVKKIIVCSGISDLSAAFHEREDKMKELLVGCIGGTPEEMPEEYEKRSAVCWADEITIPVLIFHSKGDKQAFFETQAQAIYEKLKDSTDCTFITYEDDLHGFHQDQDPAVIRNWLETH